MLSDHHLENYAAILWWGLTTARRRPFRKGDIVQVRFDPGALALAEVLYRQLLATGMHPVMRLNPTPVMERTFFQLSNPRQLVFRAPGEEQLVRRLNGSILLAAPDSLTHLHGADPKKIGKAAVAAKALRAILEAREARGDYSWTMGVLPTAELARHAGISLPEYSRQVVMACLLDSASPVAEWRQIHRRAGKIKRWLDGLGVEEFQIESASIDLKIRLGAKRRWAGISGRNIPSFELFVSPDWRGTRGVFYADQPSFRNGNIVRGVRLEFKGGRVVQANAEEGERFLKEQIRIDRGAAQIGEFSLTDRRFSRIARFMANTLLDENFGGTYGNCHIALGSSYRNTFAGDSRRLSPQMRSRLGFNDSALHWDFVNTEKKRVTAVLTDGSQLAVYENGKFGY